VQDPPTDRSLVVVKEQQPYAPGMLTAFGVTALTFMMVMYAFERRGRGFVLAFAVGCALSSAYGFLSGAWPFGVIEALWCALAARRFASPTRPG
jgi:hypothetical protein